MWPLSCTQSAWKTSRPKTAWPPSLWKWVTQDVLVAKWLTPPASSVTSGFRAHSLLHQSGSQHKAVWYCKTSNPWPFVPICHHKARHTRHFVRLESLHRHCHCQKWPGSHVIKRKIGPSLSEVEDYSIQSPCVLLFILLFWVTTFLLMWWMRMHQPSNFILQLWSFYYFSGLKERFWNKTTSKSHHTSGLLGLRTNRL